jgi:hypothetical protein
MKKTSIQTTVPASAGRNPENYNIAQAYLKWVDQPGHKHNFEVFGIELDLHLRKTLPSGTLSGYLEGLDGDIRQDAAKELLVHFL